MITVLAGGIGAAKFLRGLVAEIGPDSVTAVVNVADDFSLHGLWVCPDLDTIRYTLADEIDDSGWGRRDDSTNVMDELARIALVAPKQSRANDQISLGDKHLAAHLYRTQRRAEGATLTQVTAELCEASGISTRLLPITNDIVQSVVELESGASVSFRHYFDEMRHEPIVNGMTFDGIENTKPTPEVLDALQHAERIVIAPANPFLSIAPILAVGEVAEIVKERRAHVVALSPIIGGRAVSGPVVDMLTHFGFEKSVTSIARLWAPYAATLVTDIADTTLCGAVESEDMRCVSTNTLMTDLEASRALAADVMHIPLP
jgi:LPPG:FO 2-phospho-L-lactate transferase